MTPATTGGGVDALEWQQVHRPTEKKVARDTATQDNAVVAPGVVTAQTESDYEMAERSVVATGGTVSPASKEQEGEAVGPPPPPGSHPGGPTRAESPRHLT